MYFSKKNLVSILSHFGFYLIILFIIGLSYKNSFAQVITPGTQIGADGKPVDVFNQDSTKKQTGKWIDWKAKIYYFNFSSNVARQVDTGLIFFHRLQPEAQNKWYSDLGNEGTVSQNLFFSPFQNAGFSLGYHGWDNLRWNIDSLRLYNTTHPYSSFQFRLGSKSEQMVDLLHTQNITSRWNVSFRIKNLSEQGFYQLQKTSATLGSLSTNYQSKNEHYFAAGAIIFNKFSQNENGGITADSFLSLSNYGNRSIIPVNFPALSYGGTKSAVTNAQSSWDLYFTHNYAVGETDTTYNEDSTKMTTHLTPRFRVRHQLWFHTEGHKFNDAAPDSSRYVGLSDYDFTAYDTVRSYQHWFFIDNKFSLNTFVGKKTDLVLIEAGVANRYDHFSNDYILGSSKSHYLSNYIFGAIKKEAFTPYQWAFDANIQFYVSGSATGNLIANAQLSKEFEKYGLLKLGFTQSISNAPESYNHIQTGYYDIQNSLSKMKITQIFGELGITKLGLHIGAKNYLISDYQYFTSENTTAQWSSAFNILQIYGNHQYQFGRFNIFSEAAVQQNGGNAPVNIPKVLMKFQFAYKVPIFEDHLNMLAGMEASYNTSYYTSGYNAYFNQFYYSQAFKQNNIPSLTAFANMKIGNLRAFFSFNQLQQLVKKKNNINYEGYATQSFMFRFGFNWILIN